MQVVIATVIAVIWVGFWIYWLLAAASAKSGQARWGQFAGFRIAIIVVVLMLVRLKIFKGHGHATHDPLLEILGTVVFLLGLALAVWARVYIGRNWGMPMTEKKDPELVTTGPYSTIRHPIYTGIIVGLIGTSMAISLFYLVAAVLVGAYFVYSARTEERNMTKAFPDAYPEYKRSTKMLIPFVF